MVVLKKYYVLKRDFMSEVPREQFRIMTIKAKDSETAWFWLEVEESIATNNSQEWLLTKEELKALRLAINQTEVK